ncbi:MAG: polymerase, sigma-24 subunit, RpoE [Verrucomicrobiales bacterium]|nr:polymerase, sigma-24 subunit, RpoE [Verrucomicrobiales bacterium]
MVAPVRGEAPDSSVRSPATPMSTPSPDHTLVLAARSGDMAAFGGLVALYKTRVFATAAKYARNHHELEDLAQDIFIKAWKGLGTFRGEAPFEHWLMRLAVRACFDFLRRNRTRREKEISRDALIESGHPGMDGIGAPEIVEETEALLEVRRAMTLLAPKERHVLTLLELEEKTVREVAELTGWSETNVKVRAFRARQSLKKYIQRLRQTRLSND